MATDAAIEHGLQMAKISDETREKIRSYLPKAASVKNPIDMIASASLKQYQDTLRLCLEDPNVDMVLTFYTPLLGMKDTDLAKALMEIKAQYDKPVAAVFMSENDFFKTLNEEPTNMPFFAYTEDAMKALARLYEQRLWMDKPTGEIKQFSDVKKDKVIEIFKKAISENRDQLTTKESIEVLSLYNIRTTKSGFETSEMVKGQREFLINIESDTDYGHRIGFGFGGVFSDVVKDVSYKLLPITDVESEDIIKETKAFSLLDGSGKKANLSQIKDILQRLSLLIEHFDFISELNINPLIVSDTDGEGRVVDGRIKFNLDKAKIILN